MIIYLSLLSYMDIKTMYIPVKFQIMLLIIVIIQTSNYNLLYPIILFVLFGVYTTLKQEKIGGADIKILIILSLYFQELIIYIIFISSAVALAYIVITKKEKIPFVPFITIGVTICQILVN